MTRDPLDERERNKITLTRRQWQILDEVRQGVPRGRYLWSFLAASLRETFGDVPGSEPLPRQTSASTMTALPYAVARTAVEFSEEYPTEFEEF